jgi:hypothetical protein
MCAKTVQKLALVVCFIAVGTASGFSLAVFSIGTSAVTAVDIGYTESAGTLTFMVFSGTTVASPFVITYSAPITNTSQSDILVLGTGNLVGTTFTLDSTNSAIWLDIPAGGIPGDRVLIMGVRVAVAGLKANQVTATITSPAGSSGNTIFGGQTTALLISDISKPFSVDESTTAPLQYAGGQAIKSSSSFVITENFPTAFIGNTGLWGQTLPTRILITPFRPLPKDVQITFDATARDPNGGLFTTLSGNSEMMPRTDGYAAIAFQYTPGPVSGSSSESFTFNMTMTSPPAADSGSGIIQFQAKLIPIGAATPNSTYPSTDIPRYAERLVPDDDDLATGTTELLFPFQIQSEGSYTGVAVTNPQDYPVKITLTAYDSDGKQITDTNITNPVTVTILRNGQYSKLASEIFGEGFNKTSSGEIRLVGNAPGLTGFYMIGDEDGPSLDGSSAAMDSSATWYMPALFLGAADTDFDSVEIYNPGTSETQLALQLVSSDGTLIGDPYKKTLPAGGSLMANIDDIFDNSQLPSQGGYLKLQATSAVVFRSMFGNAQESNVLLAQLPQNAISFYIPHFATGGQYVTELTLINANTTQTNPAEISLTLLNDSGNPLSVPPATLKIKSGAQVSATIASLFPDLGSALVTGSVRVDVKPIQAGPFIMGPGVLGSVRFAGANGSASSAIPLIISPTSNCIYSYVAQDSGYYTGLAVQNPNNQATDFTVTVINKDGQLVGSYSSTLQPHARISKQLTELVPASARQTGGYIKIAGSAPLTSIGFFGTTDLRSLSVIAPQAE